MSQIKISELHSLKESLSRSRGARDKALSISIGVLLNTCTKLKGENEDLKEQLKAAKVALKVTKEYIDETRAAKKPVQTKIQFPEDNVECREIHPISECPIRKSNYRLCEVCYYNNKSKVR